MVHFENSSKNAFFWILPMLLNELEKLLRPHTEVYGELRYHNWQYKAQKILQKNEKIQVQIGRIHYVNFLSTDPTLGV